MQLRFKDREYIPSPLALPSVCTHTSTLRNYANNNLLKTILYGSEEEVSVSEDKDILESTIKFQKTVEMF